MPPTTITASFYGADDDELIYTLTTTSPILARDLASEVKETELMKLIKEEARSSLPNEDFDFKITERVADEGAHHLSITVKAPTLRPPSPEWSQITPVRACSIF